MKNKHIDLPMFIIAVIAAFTIGVLVAYINHLNNKIDEYELIMANGSVYYIEPVTETTTTTTTSTTVSSTTTRKTTTTTCSTTTTSTTTTTTTYDVTMRDDYTLLCNIVGYEYGSDWYPTAEKAKVVAVVMNRVRNESYPNNTYDVLNNQAFPGFERSYYEHRYVTEDCRAAVRYYFEHVDEFSPDIYSFHAENGWNVFY